MRGTFRNKQKSLKRRFLLILGLVTFVCFLGFGIMIICWDDLLPQLPVYQRRIFGGMIILYSILRFSRLFKKDEDDE